MSFLPTPPLAKFPVSGSTFAFGISSGSITQMNFRTAGYEQILYAITASKGVSLKADVDAVYRFDTGTSGGSIDQLAVTGSVQADIMFAGERADGLIPTGSNSLILKGYQAGFIRIVITE